MCAVDKAFAFIIRIYRTIETSDQIQTVSRLLQQSIECFLFIQQYASRSNEGDQSKIILYKADFDRILRATAQQSEVIRVYSFLRRL